MEQAVWPDDLLIIAVKAHLQLPDFKLQLCPGMWKDGI